MTGYAGSRERLVGRLTSYQTFADEAESAPIRPHFIQILNKGLRGMLRLGTEFIEVVRAKCNKD